LGFERKARLFCDIIASKSLSVLYSVRLLGFERKARLFCDSKMVFPSLSSTSWDLSVRLGYFVTQPVVSTYERFVNCWDLSVRLGYFVTCSITLKEIEICWDLSVRLGYFVTVFDFLFPTG